MFRIPPARFILPNLFTLAAFFCGFALIWKAGEAEEARHFYLAATLIPLAALFDGFDGRVARLVQGSSKFGVQYDSLSDLVAFGVGPAILMYYWALHELGTVGLVISFLFAAAAMTRLARFNVTAEEEGGCSRYFEGLPSPFAGLTIGALIGVGDHIARGLGEIPANTPEHVGSYLIGLPIALAILWFTVLQPGGLVNRILTPWCLDRAAPNARHE